ncbi:MAG: hypothetical protein ABUL44_03545, partial [Flavobacterium sp.]
MKFRSASLLVWIIAIFFILFSACKPGKGIINRQYGSNTNTYVIAYDFAKKTYDTNLVHPRIHQPTVFRINNINRLAYDVSITSRDSILAITELPDGFELKSGKKDTSETIPPEEEKPTNAKIDSIRKEDLKSGNPDTVNKYLNLSREKSFLEEQQNDLQKEETNAKKRKAEVEDEKRKVDLALKAIKDT